MNCFSHEPMASGEEGFTPVALCKQHGAAYHVLRYRPRQLLVQEVEMWHRTRAARALDGMLRYQYCFRDTSCSTGAERVHETRAAENGTTPTLILKAQ